VVWYIPPARLLRGPRHSRKRQSPHGAFLNKAGNGN
jgi:hypothetical protein